ncbi:MAG: long-chain fatty acid--CoA ligase [Treponemataceae bacterium]|nr:long-chain fatty acid--CoA ligase [Treponemataceae bacterium]
MYKTLPQMIEEIKNEHPELAAQYSKNEEKEFIPVTFTEFWELLLDVASGLKDLGVKRGDHVGIISDNRKEWQQSSMGIMALGAADVPRGSDATEKDISYILSFAECQFVFAENSTQVKKICSVKDSIPSLTTLIVYDEITEEAKELAAKEKIKLLSFDDLLASGRKWRESNKGEIEKEVEKGNEEEIATIIFTSGTTGEPKGVMLVHRNFLSQLPDIMPNIHCEPGDKGLCVLPVWHVFERLCEYALLVQASSLCYSKPVGSVLIADLAKINPQIFPAVPRVFEAVYDGIYRTMKKTGGATFKAFKFFVAVGKLHCRLDRAMFRKNARFKNDHILIKWLAFIVPWLVTYPIYKIGDKLVFSKIREKMGNRFHIGVAGGGALPPAIDEFFWAVGICLVEGYGLTETAPVVAVRIVKKPVFGTIGPALSAVQVRIMGDDGKECKPGVLGEVQVKGPTVMKGYYKRDELTAQVIDKDGWFHTGDIGFMTINREICLRGRKKDTIVLRGGENVEPLPIEQKINESHYIAASVLVGQDQRSLGALIIPVKDEILAYAKANKMQFKSYEDLCHTEAVHKLIEGELAALVNSKTGFKPFERIGNFAILTKEFEVGVELSAKQEISRYKIAKIYEKEIKKIFGEESVVDQAAAAVEQKAKEAAAKLAAALKGKDDKMEKVSEK